MFFRAEKPYKDARDSRKDITPSVAGTRDAREILDWMEENDQEWVPEGVSVGLGCGTAEPERALFDALGIQPQQVIFVDKQLSQDVTDGFSAEGFQVVQDDLFQFLSTNEHHYRVISTYGIDYILRGESLKAFLSLLNRQPESTILVVPGLNGIEDKVLKAYGWNPLYDEGLNFTYIHSGKTHEQRS